MSDMPIKVNDNVRVIPKSYYYISKNDFNSLESFHESKGPNDRHIMLGGEYKVLAINNNFYQLINKYKNNRNSVLRHCLIHNSEFKPCEFKIGQEVRLKQFNDDDRSVLEWLKPKKQININTTFTIASILNDYYIFFGDSFGSKDSLPCSWEDFEEI